MEVPPRLQHARQLGVPLATSVQADVEATSYASELARLHQ
jgi:hypothetical protein